MTCVLVDRSHRDDMDRSSKYLSPAAAASQPQPQPQPIAFSTVQSLGNQIDQPISLSHHCFVYGIMMKVTVWLLTVANCAAFAPAVRAPPSTTAATQAASASALFSTKQVQTKRREGGVADELGIPCEGECEISRYPNLPDSVHPGVLSGQALIDLLQDAKTKGTPTVSLDLNGKHLRSYVFDRGSY
jgi:hypothetical protein